uniref:Uncharacterized protein n=2 Tax=Cacopsylla melanoneura TaxID=428564 RepID=A0A8D8XKP1_9HEMI
MFSLMKTMTLMMFGERRLTRPQFYCRLLVIVSLSTVGRRTRAQSLHKGGPMTILQTLKRKRAAVLNLWPLLTPKGERIENRGNERKKQEEERKREKEEWWWKSKRVRRVEEGRMRIQMLLWYPVSQHSMRIIRTKAWRMRYAVCERRVCARSVWTRRWALCCYRADTWLRVLYARPVYHAVLYVVRILRLQCERSCPSNIWLRVLYST